MPKPTGNKTDDLHACYEDKFMQQNAGELFTQLMRRNPGKIAEQLVSHQENQEVLKLIRNFVAAEPPISERYGEPCYYDKDQKLGKLLRSWVAANE